MHDMSAHIPALAKSLPIINVLGQDVFRIQCKLNSMPVEGLLDSGSSYSVVGLSLAARLNVEVSIIKSRSLQTVDGRLIHVFGKFRALINFKDRDFDMNVLVTDSLKSSLILGNDFGKKAGVVLNFAQHTVELAGDEAGREGRTDVATTSKPRARSPPGHGNFGKAPRTERNGSAPPCKTKKDVSTKGLHEEEPETADAV